MIKMICLECSTPVPTNADPFDYECKDCGELASTSCVDCGERLFVDAVGQANPHVWCSDCAETVKRLREHEHRELVEDGRADYFGDQQREEPRA